MPYWMAKIRSGSGESTGGLTQQQVAEKAGISKPYLSQLESGQRKGTTEVLSAIARALNVSLDDLAAPETED